MKLIKHTLLVALIFFKIHAQAQSAIADSSKLAGTLHEFLNICAKVDFGDPRVQQLGTFYRAAPYIVYMGEDKARKWKTIADYTKAEDKKGVDEICFRINNTVNQDSSYRFIKYYTKKNQRVPGT